MKKTSDFYYREYIELEKSITQIASELNTYPNNVRRQLKKFGIKIRSKSETQRLALKHKRAVSPTQGKKRDEETRKKISETLKLKHKEENDGPSPEECK